MRHPARPSPNMLPLLHVGERQRWQSLLWRRPAEGAGAGDDKQVDHPASGWRYLLTVQRSLNHIFQLTDIARQ